ncbi:DNA-binding transcriptional MocR family regulator [Actinoplanes octamycinicus]|uniref:DNA-binding transcriptional MocR family regulator n=1 Tax=Actinoplanes octamycinicus TaxID=135948 RepID=A0A7W7M6T1_9ACTN|nr:PLP-dependent aminotransferase family protein [Actinoplanes octamycinicus]MBB4739080.1 DNA-binding transcriptional MocR family regulator [Actinoplanes octamycinicus]GIE60212.1 GntR family transcriptional regulator [Actinoplanes octamycinicus]
MSPISPADLAARLGRWSAGRGPLYLLLAGRLRALIDDGELPPGTGLPTDRALAAGLSAGRTTVVAAYDLLRQEGRLVRRQGSGTWVAGSAPGPLNATEPTVNPVFLHLLDPPDHVAQFACAGPTGAPPAVPAAYRAALAGLGGPDLGYHPAGHPRLRAALAERYTTRGVPTTPEQILVTTGGQQGLALLARALIAPGAEVVLQAPTYPGALEIFRESAAALLPVTTDDFRYAAALSRRPAMAYLIARCHNPSGRHLPAADRERIVAAALDTGVPLVVDDVLAELAFPPGPGPAFPDAPPPRSASLPATPSSSGAPAARDASPLRGASLPVTPAVQGASALTPPLAALAPDADQLITVGSLSKLVWGGLRIGWVRAQPALIGRLARLKAVIDLGSGVLDQLAAVELIEGLDTLVAERSELLRARHDHLCAEVRRQLPEWEFEPAEGGQTLWVRLPGADAASYAQAALREGVAVLPGGSLDPSGGSLDRLRIPFVAEPAALSAGVRAMATAWRAFAGRAAATPPPLPAIAV